jgi:hypothetical protein
MLVQHNNEETYVIILNVSTKLILCVCHKVGRTPACVKTCNSEDTMSAT